MEIGFAKPNLCFKNRTRQAIDAILFFVEISRSKVETYKPDNLKKVGHFGRVTYAAFWNFNQMIPEIHKLPLLRSTLAGHTIHQSGRGPFPHSSRETSLCEITQFTPSFTEGGRPK